MDKGSIKKVEQMSLTEKIANLSETDMAHVKECVEQAVLEEQKQTHNDQNATKAHNQVRTHDNDSTN
jgi:hypothetical protein